MIERLRNFAGYLPKPDIHRWLVDQIKYETVDLIPFPIPQGISVEDFMEILCDHGVDIDLTEVNDYAKLLANIQKKK